MRSDRSLAYLEKAKKAGKPCFLWWNSTRMHVFTLDKVLESLQAAPKGGS